MDLEGVFTVKSYDELKQLLEEHYLCSGEQLADEKPIAKATSKKASSTDTVDILEDDTVKELLKGIDD